MAQQRSPPIESGFYYDIDLGDRAITDADFPAIEAKMKELAGRKVTFERKEVSKADATKYFTAKGDEYKLELIEGLNDGEITFYTQGDFTDLCRGPHLPDSSFIKATKVMSVAGAYWRGDEKRKQLTRLYAITFPKQKELDEHLALLEEAKKRDHRKLGKELDLFTFSEKVGAGLPLWLPKGTALRERHRIEVPVTMHDGKPWLRVSLQAYNSLRDIEMLVEALRTEL